MERSEANRLIAVMVMGWTRISVAPLHWPIPMELTNALTGTTIKPYGGPWFIPPGMAVTGSPAFGVEIPDFFTDPQAMVELMGKAHIGVMPSRGAWAASRRATTGDDLFIEKHGETPMEAVALAAVEMIQQQGAAHEH